jgi:hypothetical protein
VKKNSGQWSVVSGQIVAATLLACACVWTVLPGCGSAATAERVLDEIDASRASIAADRNQLLVDLLHDKSVYATRDAVNQAKLALVGAARDGRVDLATANAQLDAVALEVNASAAIRALNRGQVEMLNVAEERANAMELGLRVQFEAAKGIFGRVMQSVELWRASQSAKPAGPITESNVLPLPLPQILTAQPAAVTP